MFSWFSVFTFISRKVKRNWPVALLLGLGILFLGPRTVHAQPLVPHLVKDINPQTPNAYPGPFVYMNGLFYFGAEDPVHGQALWQSDGTDAGTIFIKSINPTNDDASGSVIPEIVNINGTLLFVGYDANGDGELWKSDGTAAGTARLKDINPTGSSNPSSFIPVNNVLYFMCNDGVHGIELWRSDGTAAGTVMVKDINPSTGASIYEIVTIGNELYFAADDGVNGRELWKSDGTTAGTVLLKDIAIGSASSDPQVLVHIGAIFYFAVDDSAANLTLWQSDGSANGTHPVKSLASGHDYGLYSDTVVVMGNSLYFVLNPDYGGLYQLWKSDGTAAGTTKIQDFNSTSRLATLGNTLFLDAQTTATGDELWKSDGTASGTVLIKDINPGPNHSFPQNFIPVNNEMYFFANNGSTGMELWKSDGTNAGTQLVKDLNAGPDPSSAYGYPYLVVNNLIYFRAFGNNMGYELWKSDGTTAGTNVVKDISSTRTGDSSPMVLTWVGDTLYFAATTPQAGQELWKSDGTAAGTLLVKDIVLGSKTSYPYRFNAANGRLYFIADDGIHGEEIWQSDGTAAGTTLLKDINPDGFSSLSGTVVAFNGKIYFTAYNSTNGYELWQSDGTEIGTTLLKEMTPGPDSSRPYALTVINGLLYFFASQNGTQGFWRSDGTAIGTVKIADINGGRLINLNGTFYFFGGHDISDSGLWRTDGTVAGTTFVKAISGAAIELVEVNGVLFFTDNAENLWKTDGTAAGTFIIKAITAQSLTDADGTLFFVGTGTSEGDGLWESDGTASGTTLVKNILPAYDSELHYALVGKAGKVYFGAEQNNLRQLWVSDGSAAGTQPIAEIGYPFADPTLNSLVSLTIHNNKIYYAANDGAAGMELWSLDIPQIMFKAVNDGYAIAEDNLLSSAAPGILANDIVTNPLPITLKTNVSHGVLILEANGSFSYSPTANFNGTDSFTYILNNGTLTDTGMVNITVTPVNDAPTSVDDNASIETGKLVTIAVLTNDSDVDGNPLSVVSFTQPAHGTASINNNNLVYQASANYVGADSFTYTISDGNGGSATATVSLTVQNSLVNSRVLLPLIRR